MTKTVLLLMLVLITILTTLTTIAAYAGGDGNRQKAKTTHRPHWLTVTTTRSNKVDLIVLQYAANDVAEESAILSVCKEVSRGFGQPEDFTFSVTGNNPFPDFFPGNRDCVDVTIGPGEYAVSEASG